MASETASPVRDDQRPGDSWWGRLPTGWGLKPLKHVARLNPDVLPETTSPDFEFRYVDIDAVQPGVGIIGPELVRFADAPSRARRLVKAGDTVVSTVRTYLKAVARIDDSHSDVVVSTGFAVARPSEILEPRFLSRVMESEPFVQWVMAHSEGVGYPAISPSALGSALIPVPPRTEQRAIAALLDRETAKIDALLARKERLIELLGERRRSLITRVVTKGLDSTVPMKRSPTEWLGEIPSHWDERRLRHLGAAIIGLTYQPDDVVGPGEGVLVLRASNVRDGHIVLGDDVYVSSEVPGDLRTQVGDILICSRSGSRGLVGKCARVDHAVAGLTFGAFMTVFRSACNAFLYYVLNSTIFQYQSGRFLSSTINQLTVDTLKDLTVPVPPEPEQAAIASFLNQEMARIDLLVAKVRDAIDRLTERRTALISAAVTGKINLRADVDK